MASLWLLCPTTQRTENSGTKKHPTSLMSPTWDLGPWLGTFGNSHIPREHHENPGSQVLLEG